MRPRRGGAHRLRARWDFTVLSISISLIAVFIPILLMGGIIGRLFREFAVTLSLAILVSLVLSLTMTPMMCALFLKPRPPSRRFTRRFDPFAKILHGYERSLGWALRHGVLVMLVLFATIGLNIELFKIVPKGFFPQQDTGRLSMVPSRPTSRFRSKRCGTNSRSFRRSCRTDPAVERQGIYRHWRGPNQLRFGLSSTLSQDPSAAISADEVIARLREKLKQVPGAQPLSAIRAGYPDRRTGQAMPNINIRLQGDNTS